jgi:hypothetical protein
VKIEISLYDLTIFRCAMAKQLGQVKLEWDVLKITKERDLTMPERWMLPANLQKLRREELQEQIDAWQTLHEYYQSWSNELETLNDDPTKHFD